MLRVGIVGAGGMGGTHADRWRQLGVNVAAVYSRTSASAGRLAERTGAAVCESVADLVAQVDLVDICSPTTAHRDQTLLALRAGRPVICEKPLARHLDEGIDMVRAAEATGTPLYVAHVVRFFPEYTRVHALVADGAIGKPGVYRSSRVGGMPGQGWFTDDAASGGVILDLMIHEFDFARWCCGEVERVFVRRAHWAGTPGGEHALAVVRFAGGAIGHIEAGWSRAAGPRLTQVEVAGDGGLVEVRGSAAYTLQGYVRPDKSLWFPDQPPDDPYLAQLRHFLDCLTRGTTPLVTARDGLAALQVSLAALESAATGHPVTLAPLNP